MTIIGITGSRAGVTGPQLARLASHLRHPTTREVHHGDCIGVDAKAHDIAVLAGKRVVIHPPEDAGRRAFCTGEVLEPKPFIQRNHDIVDACDRSIAVPSGQESDQQRSGTWATVRYAVKTGKPVTIIHPNGSEEVR